MHLYAPANRTILASVIHAVSSVRTKLYKINRLIYFELHSEKCELYLPEFTHASTFRCSGDIIGPGYLMYKVRLKCGDPLSEQVVGELRHVSRTGLDKTGHETTGSSRHVTEKVEKFMYLIEWIYEEDGGFRVITFKGSRVLKVEFVRR